jgi:GNAT superfamily N-acetyltransferase
VATVVPFERSHLEQLAPLVNAHISSVIPSWAIPGDYLAGRLERDPGEYVVDPWIAERTTLVGLERERVVAGVHLHRYADDERVAPSYRNAGEIAWLLCWPDEAAAGRAVLAEALAQLDGWGTRRRVATADLYVPTFHGVADCWPHVGELLRQAGFEPMAGHAETLWCGRLDGLVAEPEPPLPGLAVRRSVANLSTRFTALLDGLEVGIFDVASDLTQAGTLPALRGWADVWSLEVDEELRSRGIGTWLVGQGAGWLSLGGCAHIALTVAGGDEARAAPLYRRLGWRPIARFERAWILA